MPKDREPFQKAEIERIGLALSKAGKLWSAFAAELADDDVLWTYGKGSIDAGLKAANQGIGRLIDALNQPGKGDPKSDTPKMKRRATMKKKAKEKKSPRS